MLDAARIPYFFVPGNHDYSQGGAPPTARPCSTTTFRSPTVAAAPTFGGTYDRSPTQLENSFVFSRRPAGSSWCSGWSSARGPTSSAGPTRSWRSTPDREAILITHAYIYFDDTRYDWEKHGTQSSVESPHLRHRPRRRGRRDDGEELWRNLVARHQNLIMTSTAMSSSDGLGRVTTAAAGREVQPAAGQLPDEAQWRRRLAAAGRDAARRHGPHLGLFSDARFPQRIASEPVRLHGADDRLRLMQALREPSRRIRSSSGPPHERAAGEMPPVRGRAALRVSAPRVPPDAASRSRWISVRKIFVSTATAQGRSASMPRNR